MATELPPPVETEKPNIIYVMGAGRSGSTIFGVALGNCTNVFDAGELEAWLRRSAIPNFGGTQRAQFWSDVHAAVGGDDLFGEEARLCLEHSASLFRVDRWRSRRRLRPRYRKIAQDLYQAVMRASGATHIVDTSHYPLRVRELQSLSGINLYVIYLVRDPRSVVSSFARRDVAQHRMPPLATNAYLWLTHVLSVLVFLRQRRDRRLLVRYEDFITCPEAIISQVLDVANASATIPDLTALTTGLAFQGNRILQSATIALRGDQHSATARANRWGVTRLLQLPWQSLLPRLSPKATIPPDSART
jgi:hypothetical protein